MDARRRSDGHNEPQMQVVGFHVEGQSPSPSPNSLLQDSFRTISSGSPTPVIIPPQFQREPSASRATDAAAQKIMASEPSVNSQTGQAPSTARTSLRVGQTAGTTPAVAAAAEADKPPAETPDADVAAAQQQAAMALAAAAAAAATHSSTSTSTSDIHTTTSQQEPSEQQTGSRIDNLNAAGTGAEPTPPPPAAAAAAAVESKDSKAPPVAGDKPPPKVPKPASKAERRALQDAQRAAKAAAKSAAGGNTNATGKNNGLAASESTAAAGSSGKPPKGPSAQGSASTGGQGSAGADGAAAGSRSSGAGNAAAGAGTKSGATAAGAGHKARGPLNTSSTELFAHLQQYRPVTVEGVLRSKEGGSVHPAVLALGLKYADGSITGSTARCVAMIHALSQVIADYHTPEGKSLTRDLMGAINASVDFLVRCRPLSVSMGNAIKALKLYLSKIDPAAPEDAAKSQLLTQMRDWLNEKVALADKVLVEHAVTKVYDGDVILTYAYSQVVLEVLLSAARQGRRFRVLVVDSRPELEGRQLMRRLLQADIPCSYSFLSGLSYSLREVTKVMLGAAAVLSNGTVLSRAGSAAVAMSAAASSKPVLVCCEAFKFHERVQLDSITHNELGDPDMLAHLPAYAAVPGTPIDPEQGAQSQYLTPWKDIPRLALLNLKYDAMPSEYVTMVVTEFGMIPPSSVPVILREFSESAQME